MSNCTVHFSEINRCRICGNTELVPILSLGEQCLTGVFPRNSTEQIRRAPLELVKFHGENVCGLVQLRHSLNLNQMYGEDYGYHSSLQRGECMIFPLPSIEMENK